MNSLHAPGLESLTNAVLGFDEEAVVSKVAGLSGMRIAHKRRPRLRAAVSQFLLGVAGLASITFVCFQLGFHIERTAFAYLILIVLLSLLGSFSISVLLSIIATGCLNFFFAPP